MTSSDYKTQINFSISKKIKDKLMSLARTLSVEEQQTLSYLDLIRRAIQEKYNL